MSKCDEPTVGQLVNQTARLLRRLADQRLAPLGLSSGYLPVLGALTEAAVLTQKVLTQKAGIEQPTMVATLGRMERDGIIERCVDLMDRRSARFTLSVATRSSAEAITATVAALNEEALAGLNAADRAKLRELLQKVSKTVERTLDRPGLMVNRVD